MEEAWSRLSHPQGTSLLDHCWHFALHYLALVGEWGERCTVLDEDDRPVNWPALML